MGWSWRGARAIALVGTTSCAASPAATDSGTEGDGTSTGGSTVGTSGTSAPGTASTAAGTGDSPTTGSGGSTGDASNELELNFVFVHGIKTCDDAKMDARESFADLSAALEDAIPEYVAAFEADHPGTEVHVGFARVNLYLAAPSPNIPTGEDPTQMDQWGVGFGDCESQTAGDPCTTAYEWRYRLRQEIDELLPGSDNLVLVGHSTGARTAIDLAADVGPGGVGTGDWGMNDRILGAVTIDGMVDSLEDYPLVAPLGFESMCKTGGNILGVFGSCDPGDGWCEYATHLSGSDSVHWLAENKAILTLTSVNDCGVAFFQGEGDGSLPARAQSAPYAHGQQLTPIEGSTWGPAHGERYGGFCHSAIDTASTQGHMLAVEASRDRILEWVFTSAPFVLAEGTTQTESPVGPGESTEPFEIGADNCPTDIDSDEVVVQGVRIHPGLLDGDDTPIADDEIAVELTGDCRAQFVWTQEGSDSSHDARFHWKISAGSASGTLARQLTD